MIVTATQDIVWHKRLIKAGESFEVTNEQYKKLLGINKVEKAAKKEKKVSKPKAKKDYSKKEDNTDAPDFS